jgi:hypothetical protein
MSEIEFIHRFAYARGREPIDYATQLVAMLIETRDEIRSARVSKPDAFPIFQCSLSDAATARRILAWLMDAGWTPPEVNAS